MNAEIIYVAAEGLPSENSGFAASYISKKLFELGHRTLFETGCTADAEKLKALITTGLSRSDILLVLGGIEPETGFAAKKAIALITGQMPTESAPALESVKSYCASIGAALTPEYYSAASAPLGAEIYKNELGLCPGISLLVGNKRVILLPRAEGELTHMFEGFVAPTLGGHRITVSRSVNVIGLSEAEIEAKLARLSDRGDFALNIKSIGAEFAVYVSAVAHTTAEAEALCGRAVAAVSVALGKAAYAVDSKGVQFEAVDRLREKNLTVSTAESCTGGMISEMLTDVSGASKVFEYGVSAYSNRIKTEVLKVPESIIASYSAISRETAMYMARNVREISGSSLGVSITGNAGPEASEGKAVGVVFIGIADRENYLVEELNLSPTLSREEIRTIAATTALNLVRRYAEGYPNTLPGMIRYNTVAEIKSTPTIATPVTAPVTEPQRPVAPIIEETKPLHEDKNDVLADVEYKMVFDREDENEFFTADNNEYDFVSSNRFKMTLGAFFAPLGRFFSKFVPVKGDNLKKIIIKSVFLLSLITLIVSAALICTRLTADSRERNIIAKAQEEWFFNEEEREEDGVFSAFTPFVKDNDEIAGWLTVPNTKVNNPVYQTDDNDYYLTHNMNKEKSRYGALFFDYRASLDPDNPSQNATIYGHNMKDGSMFGTLKNYKKLDFYKANPTFTLTVLEEQYTCKIFAVMVMNATAEDDGGYLYNYTTPSFETQGAFIKWVEEARERSLINTTIEVSEHDRVITLVTCTNDFDNARLVIMARLTRYGEDTAVSTSGAVLNPNPRYPEAWYEKHGKDGYKPLGGGNTSAPTSSEANSSDATTSENGTDGASSDASSDDVSSSEPTSSSTSSTEASSDQSSTEATSDQTSVEAASSAATE